jgi:hypothetical protein
MGALVFTDGMETALLLLVVILGATVARVGISRHPFPMWSKFKRLFPSIDRIQESQAAMKQQLERMEDKLCRLEDGLEAAGFLARDSLLKQRHLDFKNLTLEESFDYIYKHRIWGADGTRPLSGWGSYGEWAASFVRVAAQVIKERGIRTVTEIGCGDFNIGSQLSGSVEKYQASDISSEIIRWNIDRFSDLNNVVFQQANACVDPLPPADLLIIRQVLQHLTNAQIESVLQNVEKTGFRHVLIAEHVSSPEKAGAPNQDLPSQGYFTRLDFNSGVFIDQPPFSRPAKLLGSFSVPSMEGALLVCLWEPGEARLSSPHL